MNSQRTSRSVGIFALLLTTAFGDRALANDPPTITIDSPTGSQVFGFNEAVDVSGDLIWNPPHAGNASYTLTITLLCPRDLRVVSQDIQTVQVGDGEEAIFYSGELLTPDGSDPDDEGSFCLTVECAGASKETSINVQAP